MKPRETPTRFLEDTIGWLMVVVLIATMVFLLAILLAVVVPAAEAQALVSSGPCPPAQQFALAPGALCWRTDTMSLLVWDGSAWQSVLAQAAAATTQTDIVPGSVTFASLPASASPFSLLGCIDCVQGSSPCTGGGSGALAKFISTAWACN